MDWPRAFVEYHGERFLPDKRQPSTVSVMGQAYVQVEATQEWHLRMGGWTAMHYDANTVTTSHKNRSIPTQILCHGDRVHRAPLSLARKSDVEPHLDVLRVS